MSFYASVDGRALYSLRMSIPLAGVWVAEAAIDGEAALGRVATLRLGGVSFKAGVRRQGGTLGALVARLVGGTGGLNRAVVPQGYSAAPFSVPLRDILQTAGEQLSAASSQKVTTFHLSSWSRPPGPAGHALTALMGASPIPTLWRSLFDGSIWVGEESWPAAAVDYEEISVDPHLGRHEVYSERPDFQPGTVVSGIGRIVYVEHVLKEGRFRTQVWER